MMGPAAQVGLDFLLQHDQLPDYLHGVYILAKLHRGVRFHEEKGRSSKQLVELYNALRAELDEEIGGTLSLSGIRVWLDRMTPPGVTVPSGRLSRLDLLRAAHHHAESLAWVRKVYRGSRDRDVVTYVCGEGFSPSSVCELCCFSGPFHATPEQAWSDWQGLETVKLWPFAHRGTCRGVGTVRIRQDILHGQGLVTFLPRVGRKDSMTPLEWRKQGWQRQAGSASLYRLPPVLSWRGGSPPWQQYQGQRPEPQPLHPPEGPDIPSLPLFRSTP